MSDVKAKVLVLVQAACSSADSEQIVSPDTRLGELSLDSLKLVEVIYQLESTFSVQVDEEMLSQLETIADIIAMFDAELQTETTTA